MKTKHTPGPWKNERVPIQSQGGSNTCYKIGPFEACIYDDWMQRERGFYEDEIMANAKLIAAAPKLLEALINLVNAASGDTIENLKIALADSKATIKEATK